MMKPKSSALVCWLVYGLAIVVLAGFHEVWRDEMRALSVVMESRSIPEIFGRLRHEGHPSLWYLILYGLYDLFHATWVLKAASLSIALAALGVFHWKSPFTTFEKCLFASGYFPLYEYSVVSRNYGLGMLMLFLTAAAYHDREKRPFLFGALLFLMAHTTAHFTILSAVFAISLLIERKRKVLPAFFIGMAGVLLSIWQLLPAKASNMTGLEKMQWGDLFAALGQAIFLPAAHFTGVLGFKSLFVAMTVIFLLYAYFWRKPIFFLVLSVSTAALSLFLTLVFYHGHLRHQGVLFMLLVALFWIDRKDSRASLPGKLLLCFLLIGQIVLSAKAVYADVTRPYSSSRAFSEVLKSHPELDDAIIVGDPDQYLEAFPYYLRQQIYLVRESRFGKVVDYKAQSRAEMSWDQWLDALAQLKNRFGRPIVIANSRELGPGEGQRFRAETKKIASLKGAMHENYDVYIYR